MKTRRESTGPPAAPRLVIAGAGAGVGAELAASYLERGARVLLCDRLAGADLQIGLGAALDEAGGRARYVRCDVTAAADVRALFEAVRAFFGGPFDAFVNCIGVNVRKPLLDMREDEWDRCIDTNLKGAFRLAVGLAPQVRDGGVMINVSSTAGLRPRGVDPVYSLAKLSLNHLTVMLARELAARGIRMNAVCPGPTLSDRFLDERIIDPALAGARTPSAVAREILDEMPLAAFHGRIPGVRAVADAVDFLISDRAAFITGAVLPVDGGKALG